MACLAGMLNLLYEPTTTPMHPAKNLFRIKRHLHLATITLLFAGRAMAQSYFTVSMSGADKVKFNTGLSGPAFGGYLSMGYGFAHQVTNPVLSTGVANAGTRSHKMITFTKGFDLSTPRIIQALITGEILDKVIFTFQGPSMTINPGQNANVYTITLTGARITDAQSFFGNAKNESAGFLPPPGNVDFERISVTYQRIEWAGQMSPVTDTWR